MKPYFDYKAGNIVGLSNKSNDAADSDLLLCLTV